MGFGPSVAIATAVKAAGLEVKDIDLFEINEVIISYVLMQFQMNNNLVH